jgi:hypothetical protein
VVETWIDESSGGLSAEGCPGARLMPFLPDTVPSYQSSCGGSGGIRWPWETQPREAPPAAPPTAPPEAPAKPEDKESWWERWFSQ